MRMIPKILCLSAGLVLLLASQASAQTVEQKGGVAVGANGITSGPAATGNPATLGANGKSAGLPGQTSLLRNGGGVAIQGEKRVATTPHKAGSTGKTQN